MLLEEQLITHQQSLDMHHVPQFYTNNKSKNIFNDIIMKQKEGKSVKITAKDVPPTDIPCTEQAKVLAAAKVKEVSAAGNLDYELIVKEGVQYDITANVNPVDGIVNGAECTIHHIP